MKCLVKSCKKQSADQLKGLCMECYSIAKKLVTEGKTTWDDLAEIGMVEKQLDEFTKEFQRRKHAKS